MSAVNEILDRASRHFLAAHVWHAEHGRDLAAISMKLMASEQMGTTQAERGAYYHERLALLPSLDALKAEAVAYGPVQLAEADLRIARGAYVDADDAALQAILAYKAARARDSLVLDDRRDRAIHYVHARSAARAKVQSALVRVQEERDRAHAAYLAASAERFDRRARISA